MTSPNHPGYVWICALVIATAAPFFGAPGYATDVQLSDNPRLTELGRALFIDKRLSRDGRVACSSCHNPAHAYADSRPHAIGVDEKVGTRNAPSLVGVGNETAFFWDGRRTRLEEVVLDPLTNPVELGMPSVDSTLDQLRREPVILAKFQKAFPGEATPTKDQVSMALAHFVRSLDSNASRNPGQQRPNPLSPMAEHGRRLFEGIAGCAECHPSTGKPVPLSDGLFHDSGIGRVAGSPELPNWVQQVIHENLNADTLGPKVLSDEHWSALGRFTVTHRPADIGAFRTPSLRNVALTAPYLHDGSVATLAEAVDHEIYYHSLRRGRPVNLSQTERQAIVAFLETLTDSPGVAD